MPTALGIGLGIQYQHGSPLVRVLSAYGGPLAFLWTGDIETEWGTPSTAEPYFSGAAPVDAQQTWSWHFILQPTSARGTIVLDTSGGAMPGVTVGWTATLGVQFDLWNDGGSIATYTGADWQLEPGVPMVLAVSYSAADGWAAYLDGVLLSSGALGAAPSATAPAGAQFGDLVGATAADTDFAMGCAIGFPAFHDATAALAIATYLLAAFAPSTIIDYLVTNDGRRITTNDGRYIIRS